MDTDHYCNDVGQFAELAQELYEKGYKIFGTRDGVGKSRIINKEIGYEKIIYNGDLENTMWDLIYK